MQIKIIMSFNFVCKELAKIKNSNILHELSHERDGRSVNWCHFPKGDFTTRIKRLRIFTLGIQVNRHVQENTVSYKDLCSLQDTENTKCSQIVASR